MGVTLDESSFWNSPTCRLWRPHPARLPAPPSLSTRRANADSTARGLEAPRLPAHCPQVTVAQVRAWPPLTGKLRVGSLISLPFLFVGVG